MTMKRGTEMADDTTLDPDLREDEWLAEIAGRISPTPSSQRLLRLISAQPELASSYTASALAEEVGVTPGTIVRFAQAAGFRGWPDFQAHFRHRYLGTLAPSVMDQTLEVKENPVRAALAQDLRNLEFLLNSVDEDAIKAVATQMSRGRTLIASSGSYSAVGEIISQNARFLGFDVLTEVRGGSHLVGAMLQLRPGDTFMAIGFWQLTPQIVRATKWCHERDVATVAVTDSVFSPLAAEAEHVLTARTESVGFFQSLTSAVALGYALLAALHECGGERSRARLRDADNLYDALGIFQRPDLKESASRTDSGGDR